MLMIFICFGIHHSHFYYTCARVNAIVQSWTLATTFATCDNVVRQKSCRRALLRPLLLKTVLRNYKPKVCLFVAVEEDLVHVVVLSQSKQLSRAQHC